MTALGRKIAPWMLGVALVVSVAGDAWTQPESQQAGLLTEVKGSVTVGRKGGPLRATIGFVLMYEDTLIVAEGAFCRGMTGSAKVFELTGPARRIMERQRENESWILRQIAIWIGQSRRQALTTRGPKTWGTQADPCRPLFPIHRGAVRGASARFCWATIPGVDQYTVLLTRDGGERTSHQARGNSLTLGDLEPGAEYSWQVTPAVAAWPATPTEFDFRVLSHEEEEKLDAALAQLQDLEAALLLLSLGLHEEAIYRLDEAHDAEPRSPSILQWRGEAYAAMGLYPEAIADLRAASRLP